MCNLVSFVIVGLALTVACATASTPILCPDNEQLGNCGRTCEEKCGNSDMSECAATSCAGSGCQCKPGFQRNRDNDKCVRPEECPVKKCKAREVLAGCGAMCEGTCEHPSRPQRCKLIRCSRQGCQCDLSRGYVRDRETGRCVRNKNNKRCADKIRCPPNSSPRLCGGQCEPSCTRPEEIRCKLDPTNCTIDCHCKKGFVRNEMSGECVSRKECPRIIPYGSESD